MKIAHLILTHSFAGSERYAIELANAQAQRHEVTMVLHRRAGESRPTALAQRLDPEVRIAWVGGPRWWAVWQARRVLQRLRPEVAHAHLSGACRALRARLPGTLRLATLHIHYKPQQHAHLDALIALTPSQLPAIPAALRARTKQIDNWTQVRAASREQGLALRRQWGIPDDAFLVGGLGRTETSKGTAVFIEALKPLLRQNPSLRAAFVGAGRDFRTMQALAGSDVLLPGFASDPSACLAAFDLFVNAAYSEPFGLVFLEAMSAGLPIVATDTEGAQHLSARHGFALVPMGDATALRAAIEQAVLEGRTRQVYDLRPYALAERVAEVEAFYFSEKRSRN